MSVGTERKREGEAVTAGNTQLQGPALGRNPVHLPRLSSTPNTAVLVHGHALGMIEANRAD